MAISRQVGGPQRRQMVAEAAYFRGVALLGAGFVRHGTGDCD